MIHVLHLGLSYACNMQCRHCYVSKESDYLSLLSAKQILTCLVERGLFVTYYTFGEPLLVPYLQDIVSYGKQLGIVQVLMTNGYYLTVDRAIMLKKAGITNICVSLDSVCSEKHDANRGVSGAFSHAIRAIQNSVVAGIKTGIGCTVTQENMTELRAIDALAMELGVSYVSFLRERRNNILQTTNNEPYYTYAKDCFLHPSKHCNVLFHDVTLNSIVRELCTSNQISNETCQKLCDMNLCHSQYTLSVAPNGKVSHCNLCFDTIGNLKKNDLYAILNKEMTKHDHFICCTEFS